MELIVILFLVIINGVFAMGEIALVSSKKIRLIERSNKGSKGAKIALHLLQKPEEFLSTVQIGITLIGIIAGAYGGTAWVDDFTNYLKQFEFLNKYALEISYIFVIGIITYLSIVIGELVPKSIAFNNPEGIAIALAPIMNVLSTLTKPIVKLLSYSTKICLKVFGIRQTNEPPVTEEELKMLIDHGSQIGTFDKSESEMVKSIFRFGDRKASSIMINRQEIMWIDINDSLKVIEESLRSCNYSRVLLCNGTIDDIIGIIKVSDFFRVYFNEKHLNLRSIAQQPLFIPDTLSGLKILEQFRVTKTYNAVVVDEYGSTEGMITLHDLVENIVGELPDSYENPESYIFERSDGSYLIDGSILIDELEEKIKFKFENAQSYSTLGGFMMYHLNRIPKTGDKFETDKFIFEVVDMDGKRVDKVLLQQKQ